MGYSLVLDSPLGWVVSARIPRVASQDAPACSPQAANRPITANHLDRILAAGRRKPTTGSNQGADPDLVEANQTDKQRCEDTSDHEPAEAIATKERYHIRSSRHPVETGPLTSENSMRHAIAFIGFLFVAPVVNAEDWPQWMGQRRDNVWRESGLIDKFPDKGPRTVWRVPVAGGFAGPAVAGGRVYVTDYVTKDDVKVGNFGRKKFSGTERVLCLDEATGQEIWKYEYPVTYGISYPAGPRCTPNVNDGKVYTLGAEGNLYCFDAQSGSVVWSKDLPVEYKTKTALWGYAGHPLIDGDMLICVVGGEGSHVVAFDKHTGTELWRSLTSSEQGYSPPVIIEAAGKRQLILFHPSGVTSVDPQTGREYWNVDYEASNGLVSMTPIRSGNLLFAAGYSNKNILIELGTDEPSASVLWRDEQKTAISPVNVQPFLENDLLYGLDQDGSLYGVELKTGTRVWKSTEPLSSKRPPRSGTAFIIKQGDRFWMFNELGELIIAKMSPEGYTEIDRTKVIEPSNVAQGRNVVWSAPAWANKKVFIRNDNECICVDLAAD
jgi:outer membrane protein assembly factor BamB